MNVNVPSRCVMGVLLLAATVGSAAAARADDGHFGHPHFTARDINRSYGYSCLGAVAGKPFAQLGQVSCDGKDTCTGTGTLSNGTNPPLFLFVTGKYTVASNGIGLVTYDVSLTPHGTPLDSPFSPLPIQFVLINDGRELRGFPLPAGYAVICDLKEQ
jgi:hypothetical protein